MKITGSESQACSRPIQLSGVSVLDQFGDDPRPILEVAMDQATPNRISKAWVRRRPQGLPEANELLLQSKERLEAVAMNLLYDICEPGPLLSDEVGGFPFNRQHLGRFGAVFVAARQLAFAALSNDVPTVAVVVPDLAAKSLFPLLGRHDCCRDLKPFYSRN